MFRKVCVNLPFLRIPPNQRSGPGLSSRLRVSQMGVGTASRSEVGLARNLTSDNGDSIDGRKTPRCDEKIPLPPPFPWSFGRSRSQSLRGRRLASMKEMERIATVIDDLRKRAGDLAQN